MLFFFFLHVSGVFFLCFPAVYETKQKNGAFNEGTTHIYRLENSLGCILLLSRAQ